MIQDGRIRAIFFDFGGVLAQLDRALLADFEQRHGMEEGSFIKAMYTIPEWRGVEVGRSSEDDWMEAAKRKLDELAGGEVADISELRATMWRKLDTDVVRLARSLKAADYRVGVLSNATERLESELIDYHGIGDTFDVIVNSFRVGVAKPDVRIYALAAERIGVEAAACLHIDDLEHNVTGAREAGFRAVHHTGDFAALQAGLRSLGVEW
ncbi:MAG: HAD family phosphatase [Dehalococcoidia bacterium]